MGWNASTGRPYVFPEDTSDLNGPQIQIRPRIAWLLRTNRIDSPYRQPAEFVKRVADLGRPAVPGGPSEIETRNRSLDAEVILTYEMALDLPKGSLIGPADSLSRSFLTRGIRHHSVVHPEARWGELAQLEGKFQDHAMTGGDWLTFSNLLDQPDGLPMFPSTLEEWSRRLVIELMRSVGPAYLARMEAISRLVQVEHPRRAVVRAVQDMTLEKGAQGIIDVVAALGDAPRAPTMNTVLDIFTSTEGGARTGAALALDQWLSLGGFSADARRRVERAIVEVAHADPDEGARAGLILAPHLSPKLAVSLRRMVDSSVPPAAGPLRSRRPPGLAHYLDAAYRFSAASGDRMIERLLQEALSEDPGGRRHHAIVLIGASPYREPIASAAAELLEQSTDPATRHRAGLLMTYLAGEAHQQALVRMLRDPDTQVQAHALTALAHSTGVPAEVDLHDHLSRPDVALSAIYAAGMSGHPDVVSARDSRFAPPEVRDSACWWLRHGARVEGAL